MLPIATISHAFEGRIRFRIPSRKGQVSYFAQVEAAFAAHGGVSYVETNPLTGSVLLYHNTHVDELVDDALAQGLFRVQSQAVSPNQALNVAADWMDQAGALLQRLSQGTIDLQELLFVVLLGASMLQILRGDVLGPASTLLAYAIGILMIYRAERAHG